VKDFRSSQEINGETYVCVCCCNYDGMYRSLSCGSNGILRIGVALLVNSDTYYLCFKWKKLAFPRGITHDTSSCFVTVRSVLIVRCFPSTCHPPDHVFLIAFLVQIIFTRKTRTTPPPPTHLPPPWPPASFPTRRRSRSPRPAQMLPPDAGLGHPPPPIDARREAPGLLRGHREHRLGSHQRRQCVVASIFAPPSFSKVRRRPSPPQPPDANGETAWGADSALPRHGVELRNSAGGGYKEAVWHCTAPPAAPWPEETGEESADETQGRSPAGTVAGNHQVVLTAPRRLQAPHHGFFKGAPVCC
jgi:hypothetical protein